MKSILATSYTGKVKDQIKALGATYDKDARAWLVPDEHYEEAMRLVAEVSPKPLPPQLEAARVEVEKAATLLYAARRKLVQVKHDLVKGDPKVEGIHPDNLAFGIHYCDTSPTTECVYDDSEDHCHDFCLFCEDPHERK